MPTYPSACRFMPVLLRIAPPERDDSITGRGLKPRPRMGYHAPWSSPDNRPAGEDGRDVDRLGNPDPGDLRYRRDLDRGAVGLALLRAAIGRLTPAAPARPARYAP